MKLLLSASLLLRLAGCIYVPASSTEQPHKRLNWLELAQFNFDPYRLTNICVDCKRDGRDDSVLDCSINFDWEDPNADTTCVCEYKWQWDGANMAPSAQNERDTSYLLCRPESDELEYFQFRFETMFDLSNFTLMLSHIFKDYKDFPTPETANLFAERNIMLSPGENNDTSLVYFLEGPIEAKIMGATI
ncbi:hypothetical protein F5X99DRAFT_409258 [Biscogniauxia marginata]|nr:hypothetical protein F5X99DRAFT_409258 [Biscogniauxia marginata]